MSRKYFSAPAITSVNPFTVSLSVYDLSTYNGYLESVFGGLYHVGVVYMDVEWSYASSDGGLGVFWCAPGQCDIGTFKHSLKLGESSRSASEVLVQLRLLIPKWKSTDYNSISKNCLHFCEAFLSFLSPAIRLPPSLSSAHQNLQVFSALTYNSGDKKSNTPMHTELLERMLKEAELRMAEFATGQTEEPAKTKIAENSTAIVSGVRHGEEPKDQPVSATLARLASVRQSVSHKYSSFALGYIK